ncbi:MAG: tetratricopeptide repeat protein [Dysgonamonadaceae bacterium]|jgi:tetratricopeptide (TPR) repeat protein|nr:tetratricopeptide repeat protein [Dysgonamonadaceae bacterium]
MKQLNIFDPFKKFFNTFLFLFTGVIGVSSQDIVQQANEAYTKGEFTQAIDLYQQAVEEYGLSADACYNIGNCYYRINKIAPSILYYERALLLSPGDEDIRFNLEIAKLKTVDKIEPVGEFFLVDRYNAVLNLCNTNRWSEIAFVCFILFIGSLVLFFFTRKLFIKKLGFYSGLVLLTLVILTNVFAYNQKKKFIDRKTAIVFAATVNIKSSPDNSGTDLFILHEGAKVKIKNQLGNWKEIETADGNVGWIKSEDIEII